ncbi:MAG TPA: hypothetical protein VMH04_03155 [Candidatus Solibacter sp.]|nr:hypothetical protein [Candidatus Solibacter sp.]
MTCRELHSRFEGGASDSAWHESSEVTGHIACCVACRAFIEEQRQLREALCLVRESASSVPESLDAAVLAAYRREWAKDRRAEHERQNPAVMRTPRLRVGLRWALAAAAVLVAVGLFFIARKHNTTAGVRPTPVSASPAAQLEAQKIAIPSVARATKPKAPSMKKPSRLATALPVGTAPVPTPAADFRSLMYCDPLICTQEMDVIRVQLPVASIGRPVDFAPSGGMVNAEVLVGPDGIARGIRIEQ